MSTGSTVAVILLLLPTAFLLPHRAEPCIASGTDQQINAALRARGDHAILCPNSSFALENPVIFTAPDQRLYTLGLPNDNARATLRITNPSLTTAIRGLDQIGIFVQNIQVDGNRPVLGPLKGDALLHMGRANNQTVQGISALNTRSWSTIHFFQGVVRNDVPDCQHALVANNTIGPAGDPFPDTLWADGISLACGHSIVEGNTITDATDGAIVVFGAPGSTIKRNTIIAATRELLGGINMVDPDPVHGNYTGTLVTENVVDGRGAFIHVGIGMGQGVWGCDVGLVNYGGTVTSNIVQGKHVGYGYAVHGVRDWTVTGNIDRARHVGKVSSSCGKREISLPAAFQKQDVRSSTLQPGFQSAVFSDVKDVQQPPILRAATGISGCGTMYAHEGLYPGESIKSCDGRFRLILQLDGNLVLYQARNDLWSSNTLGKRSAVAIMQGDGNFVIYDSQGQPLWASNTPERPGARLAIQNDGNLVIYDMANRALSDRRSWSR